MKTPKRFPVLIKQGSVVVRIYRLARAATEKRPERILYSVVWSSGGMRHVAQFADLDDALGEARLKAGMLNSGRVEGAAMEREDRDELQAARRLASSSTVLAALKEWVRAHSLTDGHVIAAAEAWKSRHAAKIAMRKVKEVVDEFCRAKTKAGFKVADDHSSIFEAIKKDFGEQPIDAVGARALDAWLAKRANPVSRNTYRKRIVSVWRWARGRGYLPRDAQTEAEQTERAREDAPVIGIISVTIWTKVLELARAKEKELIPVAALAGFCGLRRSELHAQAWEDISIEQKFLRVTSAKRGTAARRLVPLSDAAIKWLLMFVGERKGLICEGLGLDKLRKLARDAKITLPENAFRHSYISHRVAATGNVAETSLDSGNSPQIIHRHYRELTSKAEGLAWFEVSPEAS